MSTSSKKFFTLVGCTSLLIWSIEAALISGLDRLPFFQVMSIVFATSFLSTIVRVRTIKKWSAIFAQPPVVWILGVLGVCGSDFFYMLAARFAPIAHVDLTDYIWPCLVVILSSFLPGHKLSKQHLLGALIALLGIYCLLGAPEETTVSQNLVFLGYLFAIIGAFTWAAFTVYSKYHEEIPPEMVGMYCGISCLIMIGCHCQFEVFIVPTTLETTLAIVLGLLGAGFAYQLWYYGVKFGDLYTISMLAYLTPVLSMGCLIVLGRATLSYELVIATLLVTSGVAIGQIEKRHFVQALKRIKQCIGVLTPSSTRKVA